MATKRRNTTTKRDVYEIVTERIIERLEAGAVPWRRPWKVGGASDGAPTNLKTGKPYRGINIFLLMGLYDSPYWLTFKQCKALGGKVRKGEKSSVVVFWNWIDRKVRERDDAGEESVTSRRIPFLRYYNVFNVEQCDGLDDKLPTPADGEAEFDPIGEAERVVDSMPNRPAIRHGGNEAAYRPVPDVVAMPARTQFEARELYYSVLFHELAHSTGHESRVGRTFGATFGNDQYSREELIAEMTAAFLCGETGIAPQTLDNSAAYVASWLKVLKNDKKLIVTAAGQAQKAADYILDRRPSHAAADGGSSDADEMKVAA